MGAPPVRSPAGGCGGRGNQILRSRAYRAHTSAIASTTRSFARARAARSLRMTRRGAPGEERRKRKRMSVWTLWFPEPPVRQVCPGRVVFLNHADLSGTNPPFDLLLAGDGVTNVCELLEVHKPRHAISARESGDEAPLMLIDAPREVVGDAGVQHSRATSFFGALG